MILTERIRLRGLKLAATKTLSDCDAASLKADVLDVESVQLPTSHPG